MTLTRIFISSVQREFAREREHLHDDLRGDPLMRCFFGVFLFDDVPASDRRPGEAYLDEVERCEIDVGLFGTGYGFEGGCRVSPTEREFTRAAEPAKHRLTFLRGTEGSERHPKMRALIGRAQAGQVRRRFATAWERAAPTRKPGSSRTQPDPRSPNDRILDLLRRNPAASRREMAAALDASESTVRYRLDKLRSAVKMEHVGPDKGGHWKVLDRPAATGRGPTPDDNMGDRRP